MSAGDPMDVLRELVAAHHDGSRETEALVREDQAWQRAQALVDAAGPYLDHVYNGPAVRIEPEGRPGLLGYEEHLTGAFAVLYRDERCAIIDNGEEPRGRWLVTMLDRLVKP